MLQQRNLTFSIYQETRFPRKTHTTEIYIEEMQGTIKKRMLVFHGLIRSQINFTDEC